PPCPLSIPPWPLQAPLPPWLFVPSLQVTSAVAAAPAAAVPVAAEVLVAAELPVAALAAGAAPPPEAPSQLVAPSFDFGAFFASAPAVGAAPPAAPEALLSTPPCPLQAPFPAWLFEPSLQVTSAALPAGAAVALGAGDAAAL